jgi:hypothetical protein
MARSRVTVRSRHQRIATHITVAAARSHIGIVTSRRTGMCRRFVGTECSEKVISPLV